MDKCSSLASWGTYGDNYKGACLKFKAKEKDGKEFFNLI